MILKNKYSIWYLLNNKIINLIHLEIINSYLLILINKVIQIQQIILISNLKKKKSFKNNKENYKLKKRSL